MQRRHSLRHLLWRGGVAAVAQGMMFTGVYPLVPHAWRALTRADRAVAAGSIASDDRAHGTWRGTRPIRTALAEWGMVAAVSALRPAGFLGLPGANGKGPRPVILLHGYAMNRANFLLLAYRLARAGLGPIYGFEYWTLGRVAAGARQLGWFIDQVRETTGASEVDLVGHSMGGVVGRYYVTLAGGDGVARNLITLGSPHAGTDVSAIGIGHPGRELVLGSKLVSRLAVAPPPQRTRMTVVWSRADSLVPASVQASIPYAEVIEYDDLGHVALLGSRRVAAQIVTRLSLP